MADENLENEDQEAQEEQGESSASEGGNMAGTLAKGAAAGAAAGAAVGAAAAAARASRSGDDPEDTEPGDGAEAAEQEIGCARASISMPRFRLGIEMVRP